MKISRLAFFKGMLGAGLAALLPKMEAVETVREPFGDWLARIHGAQKAIMVNADHPNAGTSALHGSGWDMPLATLQDAIDRAATIKGDAVIYMGR